MDNQCVCCGAIIPEGRQVCPNCENAPMREKLIAHGVAVAGTNLEKYRNMLATDEGLAEFLMKAHDGEVHIPFCRSDVVCKGEDDPMGEGCKACMMAWLKKTAEEGGK